MTFELNQRLIEKGRKKEIVRDNQRYYLKIINNNKIFKKIKTKTLA